jgi:hypothetical protein
MINPAREYRKHAAACHRLARVASDDQTRDVWSRLAKRWELCAELAERETSSAQRLSLLEQGRAKHASQAAVLGA